MVSSLVATLNSHSLSLHFQNERSGLKTSRARDGGVEQVVVEFLNEIHVSQRRFRHCHKLDGVVLPSTALKSGHPRCLQENKRQFFTFAVNDMFGVFTKADEDSNLDCLRRGILDLPNDDARAASCELLHALLRHGSNSTAEHMVKSQIRALAEVQRTVGYSHDGTGSVALLDQACEVWKESQFDGKSQSIDAASECSRHEEADDNTEGCNEDVPCDAVSGNSTSQNSATERPHTSMPQQTTSTSDDEPVQSPAFAALVDIIFSISTLKVAFLQHEKVNEFLKLCVTIANHEAVHSQTELSNAVRGAMLFNGFLPGLLEAIGRNYKDQVGMRNFISLLAEPEKLTDQPSLGFARRGFARTNSSMSFRHASGFPALNPLVTMMHQVKARVGVCR